MANTTRVVGCSVATNIKWDGLRESRQVPYVPHFFYLKLNLILLRARDEPAASFNVEYLYLYRPVLFMPESI